MTSPDLPLARQHVGCGLEFKTKGDLGVRLVDHLWAGHLHIGVDGSSASETQALACWEAECLHTAAFIHQGGLLHEPFPVLTSKCEVLTSARKCGMQAPPKAARSGKRVKMSDGIRQCHEACLWWRRRARTTCDTCDDGNGANEATA